MIDAFLEQTLFFYLKWCGFKSKVKSSHLVIWSVLNLIKFTKIGKTLSRLRNLVMTKANSTWANIIGSLDLWLLLWKFPLLWLCVAKLLTSYLNICVCITAFVPVSHLQLEAETSTASYEISFAANISPSIYISLKSERPPSPPAPHLFYTSAFFTAAFISRQQKFYTSLFPLLTFCWNGLAVWMTGSGFPLASAATRRAALRPKDKIWHV